MTTTVMFQLHQYKRPKAKLKVRKDLYEQMSVALLRVIPRHEDGARLTSRVADLSQILAASLPASGNLTTPP